MGDAGKDGRRRATAAGLVIEAVRQWLAARPRTRLALLALYYFAIVAALAAMYGRGNFETPEFVYQEF